MASSKRDECAVRRRLFAIMHDRRGTEMSRGGGIILMKRPIVIDLGVIMVTR